MSSSDEEENHSSDEEGDSAPESEDGQVHDDPLKLEPTTFTLPDIDEDYELWTIRMPVSVDHTGLHGVKLSLDKKVLGMIQSGGHKFGVVLGDAFENESFRVLVEADDNLMIPTTVPFGKHLNLVHADAIKEIPQTDLAPGIDRAPVPVDPIRKAYSVVPQKTGLKRRWMPSGAPPALSKTKKAKQLIQGLVDYHSSKARKRTSLLVAEIKDATPIKCQNVGEVDDDGILLTQENPTPTKRKVNHEDDVDGNESGKVTSSSKVKKEADNDSIERRSAKKAKKEAKKAKKKDKKAVKEEKKAKKDKRKSKE
jgi:hypothetical protein